VRSEGSSPRLRVILDANLYLSYFLPPVDRSRTIYRLVDLLVRGAFQLVLPEELIDEVYSVIRAKPFFRDRISEQGARGAMADIVRWADIPPRLSDIPGVVRDPKDDYLIAHAILGRVDFLVTGDRDLLALDGEVDPLQIVTAAAFLQIVEPDAGDS